MASAKKKALIVGNWKMYVESAEAGRKLALALKRRRKRFQHADLWIAPPMPLLAEVAKSLKGTTIRVGAQGVSGFENGPHTGEVSAKILKDSGAAFSIVGHSERRALGEDNPSVAAQLQNLAHAGLRGLLCVGESLRDEHGGHFEFLAEQLGSALKDFPRPLVPKLVVAYEPLWAIGKSAEEAAEPELVREVIIFIRKLLAEKFGRAAGLKVPVLYGGSVEGENASRLFTEGDVDGFLVGRASADADTFFEIIASCV